MSDNPLVHISSHPLVKHKLSILRDVKTKHKLFRELIEEITIMLVYESLLNTPVSPVDVQTPVGISQGETLAELDIAFVPILRAGLGMLDGALNILPSARVWHLGLYRDETSLRPVHYYNKLGNYQVSKISLCIILDPMLATGGSINAAIDLLKQKGAKKIKVCQSSLSFPLRR